MVNYEFIFFSKSKFLNEKFNIQHCGPAATIKHSTLNIAAPPQQLNIQHSTLRPRRNN